jgi:hypothetical protein
MRIPIAFAMSLAASSAAAQGPLPEIRTDVGIPGEVDRYLVVTVRSGVIEGCVTSASRVCTRTRRIELDGAGRRELAMPRCEPVAHAPGDLPFTLDIGGRVARGHLPRDRAQVAARTDEHCEAEHALAWWLVQRFGGT